MNKADTLEGRSAMTKALNDSEAVQGARQAVKELLCPGEPKEKVMSDEILQGPALHEKIAEVMRRREDYWVEFEWLR